MCLHTPKKYDGPKEGITLAYKYLTVKEDGLFTAFTSPYYFHHKYRFGDNVIPDQLQGIGSGIEPTEYIRTGGHFYINKKNAYRRANADDVIATFEIKNCDIDYTDFECCDGYPMIITTTKAKMIAVELKQ